MTRRLAAPLLFAAGVLALVLGPAAGQPGSGVAFKFADANKDGKLGRDEFAKAADLAKGKAGEPEKAAPKSTPAPATSGGFNDAPTAEQKSWEDKLRQMAPPAPSPAATAPAERTASQQRALARWRRDLDDPALAAALAE